jgi:hypothetical protein
MKRIRVFGLCLVAAFAMSAVAVSSAVASPPDFGTCVKMESGGLEKNCAKNHVIGKPEYGWEPWLMPGFKWGFSSKLKEGTPTLEGTNLSKITCTAEEGAGKITGEKTVGNVTAKFNGCKTSGLACSNGSAEEINTNELDGELGIEKTVAGEEGKKNKIGLDLKPESGEFDAKFECAGLEIRVRGSVIHPVKTNSMVTTATEKFSQKAGKQKPEKFEGQPKDILESSTAGGAFEQSGQAIVATVKYEEAHEVNSVH